MKKHTTPFALAILILLACLFNGKLLTGYIPAGTDDCLFYYPFFSLFQLKPFPLWTPYEFCGMSLVANPQYAMFYPLQALFILFPIDRIYGIHGFLHFLIANVTAFFCFRVMGLSLWSSLFGAIVFGQGSFIQGRISNPTLFYSCVWFPLILAATVKAFDAKTARYTPLCGMALALLAFTGSPHNIFYSHLLVLLYLLYRTRGRGVSSRAGVLFSEAPSMMTGPLLGRYVIILVVFFSVYAVAFLPFAQLAAETIRARASFSEVANDPVAPSWLGNLFLGGTGVPEYTDKSTYAGIIALAMIALSLFLVRDRRMIFFILLALISVLIALGGKGGIYHILYQLPFTRNLIGPARSLILFVLALSALSALAFENFTNHLDRLQEDRFRRAIAFLATAALIALALIFLLFDTRLIQPAILYPKWTPPALFVPLNLALFLFLFAVMLWLFSIRRIGMTTLKILLLAILVVDLYHFRQRVFIYYRQPDYFDTPQTVEFLRKQAPQKFRVLGYIPSQLHFADINNERIVGVIGAKLPNLYRIEAVQGFDPMLLRRYVTLMSSLGGVQPVNDPFRTAELADPYGAFTDIMNVKYIIGDPSEYRPPKVALPVLVWRKPVSINLDHTEPITGIGFISLLDYSLDIPQGTEVAEVRVADPEGRERVFPVRAGIETADLRASSVSAAHSPAFSAMNFRGLYSGIESTLHNYYCRINFGEAMIPKTVVFAPVSPRCYWVVQTLTVFRPLDEQRFHKVLDNGYLSIFENLRALPRAWLARHVQVVREPERFPLATTMSAAKLRDVAFVEGDVRLPDELATNGEIEIRDYTPNEIWIEVRVSEPAFLVLSELYDPGWKVYVNGVGRRIFRTDYCLRGVALDPGVNMVYFKYRPPAFVIGATITALALAALCVYLVLLAFRRDRAPLNTS